MNSSRLIRIVLQYKWQIFIVVICNHFQWARFPFFTPLKLDITRYANCYHLYKNPLFSNYYQT